MPPARDRVPVRANPPSAMVMRRTGYEGRGGHRLNQSFIKDGLDSFAVGLTLDQIADAEEGAFSVEQARKETASIEFMHYAVEPEQAGNVTVLVLFAKVQPLLLNEGFIEYLAAALLKPALELCFALALQPARPRLRVGLSERDDLHSGGDIRCNGEFHEEAFVEGARSR